MRKVVAQKEICITKNPMGLPQPLISENHAVRNGIHLENCLRNRSLRIRQSKLRGNSILSGKSVSKNVPTYENAVARN